MAIPTLRALMELRGEKFVRASFVALLGREVDPEGLVYYMARLRRGVDRLDILGDLALSREGPTREADVEGLGKALRARRWLRLPVLGWLIHLTAHGCSKRAVARHNMIAEQIEALSLTLAQWGGEVMDGAGIISASVRIGGKSGSVEARSLDTADLRAFPRRSLSVLHAIS